LKIPHPEGEGTTIPLPPGAFGGKWYHDCGERSRIVGIGAALEAGPSPREPELIRNPRIKTRDDVIEEGIRASDDVFADGMEREAAFRLGIGVALSLWEDILGVRGESLPSDAKIALRLPDTFVERAIQVAHRMVEPNADATVMLSAFEAGYIRGYMRVGGEEP